jgi:hypothetical protein
VKIKGKHCPVCNLEIHGEVESRGGSTRPKEGDVGVCLNCGTILTFVVVGDRLERKVASQEVWDQAQGEGNSLDVASIERVQRFVRRRKNISSIQS